MQDILVLEFLICQPTARSFTFMNQDQIVKCKGKESYIYKIRWWYVELIAGINWLASASKVLITSFNFICQWLLFGFCLCVSEETLICALSEMTGPLLCLGLQLQGQHCWLLPGGLCHPSAPTAREFSLLWFCHLTVWIREQWTQAERKSGSMEIRQHRILANHFFHHISTRRRLKEI